MIVARTVPDVQYLFLQHDELARFRFSWMTMTQNLENKKFCAVNSGHIRLNSIFLILKFCAIELNVNTLIVPC